MINIFDLPPLPKKREEKNHHQIIPHPKKKIKLTKRISNFVPNGKKTNQLNEQNLITLELIT